MSLWDILEIGNIQSNKKPMEDDKHERKIKLEKGKRIL